MIYELYLTGLLFYILCIHEDTLSISPNNNINYQIQKRILDKFLTTVIRTEMFRSNI